VKKYSLEWWQTLPPEKVGKETECLIESLFTEWNKRRAFAWLRLPDSKSARNFIKAQPADYIYRCGTYSGFLEVKALKHPYRLPRARVSQLPTLNKWSMAGSHNLILVFHYMEGQWRIVTPKVLATDVPSWDLTGVPTHANAEDALLSTSWFNSIK